MSSRTYTVSWSQPCPDCEGKGHVQHPAWKAYWDAFQTYPDDDVILAARFADLGWPYVPDEDGWCAECEGAGTLTGTCDLKTALAELTAQANYDAQMAVELADAQAFAAMYDEDDWRNEINTAYLADLLPR